MKQQGSRIKRGMTGGVGLRIPADDRAAPDRIATERGVSISTLRDAATRPQIDVSGGDLHRWIDQAWAALVAANDEEQPFVLVRGNELVRMTERGELEPYNVDSLRDELSRVADFGIQAEHEWIPKTPPYEVARSLLARDSVSYVGAPRVERVVDVPVLTSEGEIASRPGYHAGSRLFHLPSEDLADAGPGDVEQVDSVQEAHDLLVDELLGDFAFADQASRANALGLLLLPFVRDFIGDGPTPMHVILAPEPGTGKTLLAEAALFPGCGLVPVTAEAGAEDEVRKRLTAILMRGARAVIFDNVGRALESPTLAAALTSGMWRDRVLGYSKEVALPVRNVWVATGNNTSLTDEHARRAVPIFLEPGNVRPADRPKTEFRHPDLMAWARQNRAALASAALTLVRHWLAGESVRTGGGHRFVRTGSAPLGSERTLGSFERWAEVIGGILEAAGVKGFLANRDRLLDEANDERREAAGFLAAWHGLGMGPRLSQELASDCVYPGPLYNYLPSGLMGTAMREDKMLPALRDWLKKNRGRRFGGYQLVAVGNRHPLRWDVRPAGAPSPDGGTG
jgi:putative DNA primase/helicase